MFIRIIGLNPINLNLMTTCVAFSTNHSVKVSAGQRSVDLSHSRRHPSDPNSGINSNTTG